MSIEEMKDRIVDDQIAYIRDLVLTDKYDELFGFVDEKIFSSFKDISDEEIKEEYESIYGEEA